MLVEVVVEYEKVGLPAGKTKTVNVLSSLIQIVNYFHCLKATEA